MSLVLVAVLWNQKWRGAISFTAHKMRAAKRGLISNILLVKKNTWKCQGKECLWAVSGQDLDLIDCGLSSNNTRPGASPTPSHAEALAEKSRAWGNMESLSPHVSAPHPGGSDPHIYQHILTETFTFKNIFPANWITFLFLWISSNLNSQRIPAWLGFIPQPFPNDVKLEWSAILTLQKRNCTTDKKSRFYIWIKHFILCCIPVGIRCFHISATWVKGLESHKLLGTTWNSFVLF